MASGLGTFYSLLLVQIFFGVAITLLVMTLPISGNQVTWFNNSSGVMNFATTATSIQSSMTNATKIPLLDFGSLVFYSSNIIFNLMINIVFAIPEMLSIFMSIIFFFVPIDYTLQLVIKGTFIMICTILYYIILLSFITGTRVPTYGGVR